MAQTRATPEQLTKLANQFESGQGELKAQVSRIQIEVDKLKADWQGEAGNAVQRVMNAIVVQQDKINLNLNQTAEAVRTAGTSFEATDQENVTSITRINVDL